MQIRTRCIARERKGLRKYPRAFNSPIDKKEQIERRDNMYLNRVPTVINQWGIPKGGQATQLYDEIRSWKPQ